MIVFLTQFGDRVEVIARADGGTEGMVGDLMESVEQGGQFLGIDYDDLIALGDGEHEIPDE